MAFLCLTPIETALFDHLFDGVTRSDDQPRAAHDLFIRSRLPRGTLAHVIRTDGARSKQVLIGQQIWRLAGVSQNGVLSRERFYIAMRLIALCQQGYEPTADNAKTITCMRAYHRSVGASSPHDSDPALHSITTARPGPSIRRRPQDSPR